MDKIGRFSLSYHSIDDVKQWSARNEPGSYKFIWSSLKEWIWQALLPTPLHTDGHVAEILIFFLPPKPSLFETCCELMYKK